METYKVTVGRLECCESHEATGSRLQAEVHGVKLEQVVDSGCRGSLQQCDDPIAQNHTGAGCRQVGMGSPKQGENWGAHGQKAEYRLNRHWEH